jgi:hypothetical protein
MREGPSMLWQKSRLRGRRLEVFFPCCVAKATFAGSVECYRLQGTREHSMTAHLERCARALISGVLCTLAIGLGVVSDEAPSALAQSEPDPGWTVLTVAHSGTWGLSTARSQGEAIAGAVRQCQSRAADDSDCGAQLLAYKVGWGLAILCDDSRVLVSAVSLEEAETVAYERIAVLRQSHASSPLSCHRLLTVDPEGAVTTGEASLAREMN